MGPTKQRLDRGCIVPKILRVCGFRDNLLANIVHRVAVTLPNYLLHLTRTLVTEPDGRMNIYSATITGGGSNHVRLIGMAVRGRWVRNENKQAVRLVV
jgi:hypothetical protein